MRRLSEVIVPANTAGKKGFAFMHVNVKYGTARFSVLMHKHTGQYNFVEFLEDEDMLFALFNNSAGYDLRECSYKNGSVHHIFTSKALTHYWLEKYNVQERTAKFVCSIGAAEDTEEGLKVPIFYQKPRVWK
jgi:hypothetical protein